MILIIHWQQSTDSPFVVIRHLAKIESIHWKAKCNFQHIFEYSRGIVSNIEIYWLPMFRLRGLSYFPFTTFSYRFFFLFWHLQLRFHHRNYQSLLTTCFIHTTLADLPTWAHITNGKLKITFFSLNSKSFPTTNVVHALNNNQPTVFVASHFEVNWRAFHWFLRTSPAVLYSPLIPVGMAHRNAPRKW